MTDLSPYGDPDPSRWLHAGAIISAGALCLGALFAGAVNGGGETVAPGWHGAVDCDGNIVSAVPGVGEQGTVRIAYEPPLLVWYGANDEVLDTAYPTKPDNCVPPTTPAPTTTVAPPQTTTTTGAPPSSTSTTSPPDTPTSAPPDSSVPSSTSTPPETSAAPTTTSPTVPTAETPPTTAPAGGGQPTTTTSPRPQTTQPEPYCTRFPNAEGCIEGLPTAETG